MRNAGLNRLSALIDSYRPDLVLVEIRQEAFKKGWYDDGPFEMTYITSYAQSKGIAVKPIDWYHDEEIGRPQPAAEASAQVDYDRETSRAKSGVVWPPTYEKPICEDITLRNCLLSISKRDTWEPRAPGMFVRHVSTTMLFKQLKDTRRAMAFVRARHRVELQSYLDDHGGAMRSPLSIEIANDVGSGSGCCDSAVEGRRGAHEKACARSTRRGINGAAAQGKIL